MRVQAIVIRIIQQFFRDKRTLALMLLAPLLILTLMYLVFHTDDYVPTIAVHGVPSLVQEKLSEQGAIIEEESPEEAQKKIQESTVDAFITLEHMTPAIILEGSDPTLSKAILMMIHKSFQELQPNQQLPEPIITYVYGSEEMRLFDYIGPVLIGYFIFFFVFLLAGVSFLRERTSGTLERLLATPLRRWEIVAGYVLGFGLFTTIQATVISWFAVRVLGINMEGSFLYVLLITFLLAMTALTLGTLLSAFANNELQMIQFIPLVIIPQIFFSGLFNLDSLSVWLRSLSIFMPITYGANALREIMIRGNGWAHIDQDVYVLLGFSFGFMILNVLALKKHRKL